MIFYYHGSDKPLMVYPVARPSRMKYYTPGGRFMNGEFERDLRVWKNSGKAHHAKSESLPMIRTIARTVWETESDSIMNPDYEIGIRLPHDSVFIDSQGFVTTK